MLYICQKEDQQSRITFSKNAESAFSQDGFGNWKRAVEKFKVHKCSLSHREATIKFNARQNQQPISQQLSSLIKKEQQTRRMCLIKQIESLSYLLHQGLAVCGHKETKGNLARLLKLRAIDVPELERWCTEKNTFLLIS